MLFKKYYNKNVPKKYRQLGKQSKYPSSMAQLVKRINYVRSLVNVEYKTFDAFSNINASLTNISLIGAINTNSVCLIPQGTTEQTRVGNSIKMKSIYLNYMVNANASASSPQNVRVLLIKDTNRDVNQAGALATAPTLGNVLRPDDLATGRVDNICAPLNDATSGRYKILMNKTFSLDRQARPGVLIRKVFKLNDDIKYPVNTESLPINGYYLVFMTDSTVNVPTLTGTVRVRFIDN